MVANSSTSCHPLCNHRSGWGCIGTQRNPVFSHLSVSMIVGKLAWPNTGTHVGMSKYPKTSKQVFRNQVGRVGGGYQLSPFSKSPAGEKRPAAFARGAKGRFPGDAARVRGYRDWFVRFIENSWGQLPDLQGKLLWPIHFLDLIVRKAPKKRTRDWRSRTTKLRHGRWFSWVLWDDHVLFKPQAPLVRT